MKQIKKISLLLMLSFIALSFGACSTTTEDIGGYQYTIGVDPHYSTFSVITIDSITGDSIKNISSPLDVIITAMKGYEDSFTYDDSEIISNAKAIARFNVYVAAVQVAANTVTNTSGYITYTLWCKGNRLATQDVKFTEK